MTITEIIQKIEEQQRLLQEEASNPIKKHFLEEKVEDVAQANRANINVLCRLTKELAQHVEHLSTELSLHQATGQ